MHPTDAEKFKTLLQSVYGFYSKGLSQFTLDLWWKAMRPFELQAVMDALSRHCVNPDVGQFLPMPADVVRMLQGSTQDAALVAWAKVEGAVRQVGVYVSVVFDDPLIHRVLYEMGGWIPMGAKSEEEWPFVRNEWVNRYRGYRMRSETPAYPSVLIGLTEAHNARTGWKSEPPILIGNVEAAQRVLAGGACAPLLDFTSLALIQAERIKLAPQKAA